MRRSLIVGLCGVVLLAACTSGSDSLAESSVHGQASTTVQTSTSTGVETTKLEESTTSAPEGEEPTPLRIGLYLVPGTYETDVLPVGLEIDIVEPYRVSLLFEGAILFETPDSSFEDFRGVAILESDVLINGLITGVPVVRTSISTDLSEWAGSLDHAALVAEGEGQLGGLSGRWWQLQANSESADDWAPLFSMADGNTWGLGGGFTQRIWAIDVDGSVILVVIEGATEDFDSWVEEATETFLDRVEFGESTGHSLRSPLGPSAGPYKVAHTELALRDGTRSTQEVTAQAGIIVPAESHRQFLVSVGYPSELGGSDASPSSGPFPLLVIAPSLGGSGVFTFHDRTLISQGYVVVRVRFPETSFPGAMRGGIHEQPADVSFILDQLLSDALSPEVRDLIDPDHIGMIGNSIGGTATYGLLGSACCSDERIMAGISHAGTPFDFTDGVELTETPLLIVGSQRDFIVPNADLRTLYGTHPGSSYFLNFERPDHLSWLDPEEDEFAATMAVSLAFFDRHLKDDETVDFEQVLPIDRRFDVQWSEQD